MYKEFVDKLNESPGDLKTREQFYQWLLKEASKQSSILELVKAFPDKVKDVPNYVLEGLWEFAKYMKEDDSLQGMFNKWLDRSPIPVNSNQGTQKDSSPPLSD
jgi:hypothetical protein